MQKKILDAVAIKKTLKRLSYEIIEKHSDLENVAIVGIQRRGVFLAQRICQNIKEIESIELPLGVLDITLYRDDLTAVEPAPVVRPTNIDFDINDKTVILVDDVLFTGRTIRCALSEIMDFGRPKAIELCVLVDRGHRELPIRADYAGKNIPTAHDEIVDVLLKEVDDKDEVIVKLKVKS